MTTKDERVRFGTTRWSLVDRARSADAKEVDIEAALQELCAAYWAPLYGFARRRGIGVADAEDSTQSFFAALLSGGWLESVDRDRGRFRTYLLTLFQRHLTTEWRRANSVKRGGQVVTVSLELAFEDAETIYQQGLVRQFTPQQSFDYQWALAVLDRVWDRVRERYAVRGQLELAESLKPLLAGAANSEVALEDVARNAGKSVATLRVTLHRLRERYRDALYAEVAETVVSPDDVEAEIEELLDALRGPQ